MRTVHFPPVGIAHMVDSIQQLINIDKGSELFIVNTSSQPNSNPHLGTVTTIMTSFGIASLIRNELGINAIVQFDQLENSPCKLKTEDGVEYSLALDKCQKNGVPVSDLNMQQYYKLFDYLSKKTKINYQVRTYKEFQSLTKIRLGLLNILSKEVDFAKLLQPVEKKLHVRIPCDKCGWVDKKSVNTNFDFSTLTFTSYCSSHGEFKSHLFDKNIYIDLNTQLRDLLKGVLINEDSSKNITLMCDANDWSGVWNKRVHIEGLIKMGYNTFPERLFAPLILDWSGAKFSKSLYINDISYSKEYNDLLTIRNFVNRYGENGLEVLWDEVYSWVKSPKKFFRNYSLDYLKSIIEKGIAIEILNE